jgi:hypothetical protein
MWRSTRRQQIAVLGAWPGSLDGLFQGLAGFFRAELVFENEHQVAAGLNEERIQLDGFSDQGLGFAVSALRGEPGAHVTYRYGDGRRRRAASQGLIEVAECGVVVSPAKVNHARRFVYRSLIRG